MSSWYMKSVGMSEVGASALLELVWHPWMTCVNVLLGHRITMKQSHTPLPYRSTPTFKLNNLSTCSDLPAPAKIKMPSIDSTTNDHSTGFLGDLEPSIKRFPYQGKRRFNSIMKQEFERREQSSDPIEKWSEWVLFTDLDEETFTRDFLNSSNDTPRIDDWTANCPSYDSSLRLLLTKMRFFPHEVAPRVFERLLSRALIPMGLDGAIRPLGSATIFGTGGTKEADGSWAPYRPPRGHPKKMPTVVLEVALSEPQSKLSSDVRFWLNQTNGNVKVVLTLTINRKRPQITMEKWELRNDRQHRTGRVDISMGTNKQVRVDGGPLVIEFEKLFLRPAEDAREGDITFDTNMLEELATGIWKEQEFVEW